MADVALVHVIDDEEAVRKSLSLLPEVYGAGWAVLLLGDLLFALVLTGSPTPGGGRKTRFQDMHTIGGLNGFRDLVQRR
jgi:hypothetical protein